MIKQRKKIIFKSKQFYLQYVFMKIVNLKCLKQMQLVGKLKVMKKGVNEVYIKILYKICETV